MRIPTLLFLLAVAPPAMGENGVTVRTELTEVQKKPLERTVTVPGEIKPYQRVEIHAKVDGFVKTVRVDRGSQVKEGELLAELSAPELEARRSEAQARVAAAVSKRLESEAKLAAAESTLQRLQEAAKTPGAVAGNDIVLAESAVDAERARLEAAKTTVTGYESAVRSIEEIENYLMVHAPFSGRITERHVHVGALVGPSSVPRRPLLTLQEMARLRLVAAIPEAHRQSIRPGRRVGFTVAAFPGEAFSAVVARPAYAVQPDTRTMPVELDLVNPMTKLTPGMYAEVEWPAGRAEGSLFVPATAIQATTERIFVVRVTDGKAEWVDVRRGMSQGDSVEVFGDLAEGDRIVLRATDEIRPGARIEPR